MPERRIARREFKYLVDASTAAALRRAVQPYCALDRAAQGQPDDRYTIDSLYLDTRDLQLFGANELELPRRFKARIRSYPRSPGDEVYLEIKARDGDVILKTRGRVDGGAATWQALVTSPPARVDDPAIERFIALKMRHTLEPVLLVRYEREPWVGTLDPYVRVTFDTGIRHQRMDRWSLQPDDTRWRPNDHAPAARQQGDLSPIVVELKFAGGAPRWLAQIVARLDLDRQAFSKYGTAVQSAFTHPNVRQARNHVPRRPW